MTDKKLHLKIITPGQTLFDRQVSRVIVRAKTGDMGILPGHAHYSAVLDYGVLRIQEEENERLMAVYGGLAVVQNNQMTILTDDAEWPEEIDLIRANMNREQAEQRLREKLDDMEIQNDQVLLRRALVQIEVSASLHSIEEDIETY